MIDNSNHRMIYCRSSIVKEHADARHSLGALARPLLWPGPGPPRRRARVESTIHEHDLEALRNHPDYPGEEAHREELVGLSSVLKGARPTLRGSA